MKTQTGGDNNGKDIREKISSQLFKFNDKFIYDEYKQELVLNGLLGALWRSHDSDWVPFLSLWFRIVIVRAKIKAFIVTICFSVRWYCCCELVNISYSLNSVVITVAVATAFNWKCSLAHTCIHACIRRESQSILFWISLFWHETWIPINRLVSAAVRGCQCVCVRAKRIMFIEHILLSVAHSRLFIFCSKIDR